MNSNEYFNGRNVALGSIYIAIQNILSTLIGILGYAFLARAITQEEMGIITGLIFLVSLIQLISDLGLNSSLIKSVSELKGKKKDISSHVISAIVLRLPITFFLCSILILFSEVISINFFRTQIYSDTIKLLSIDALIISVLQLLNSILWGCGRLKGMAVFNVISLTIRWTAIILFLLGGYGILGVVSGWIVGDTVNLLLYITTVWRIEALNYHALFKLKKILYEILKFSIPLYIASFVSFLYAWYDKALILAYLPLQDLGVYNVAYTAYGVLTSLTAALGTALFPYYGTAYGRQDHQSINIAIKKAIKYSMLAISPLALGLFATARPVIMVFAGQQYEPGWTVLAVLSLFSLVHALSPAFGSLLLIYGRTKTILLLSFIPVVLSLPFLPLLWFFGLTGLALMRGVSLIASFGLSTYSLSKIVKIEVDKAALVKIVSSSAVMAIAVLLLEQFYYVKALLPVYVVTGGLIYIAMIKTLKVLDTDDFVLFKQVLGFRIGKHIQEILQ